MAVLILALWIYWKSNKHLRAENSRLSHTIENLGSTITYLKGENGKLIAQSDVLSLRMEELKSLYPQKFEVIKSLQVKPSRARQINSFGSLTQKTIVTVLRDSLILDTIHVRTFHYTDPWLEINGLSVGDSQKVRVRLSDTLIQVVFKGERTHPWLWVFSPRKLQQRAQLASPYSNIFYQQAIDIQSK
jgi:hypothetical protein